MYVDYKKQNTSLVDNPVIYVSRWLCGKGIVLTVNLVDRKSEDTKQRDQDGDLHCNGQSAIIV